jgi:hypothetical protein
MARWTLIRLPVSLQLAIRLREITDFPAVSIDAASSPPTPQPNVTAINQANTLALFNPIRGIFHSICQQSL